MRILLLLYSSYVLVDSFGFIRSDDKSYQQLPLEGRITKMKIMSDEFIEIIRSLYRFNPEDVEQNRQDHYNITDSLAHTDILELIHAEFLDKYSNNSKVQNHILEKKEDLKKYETPQRTKHIMEVAFANSITFWGIGFVIRGEDAVLKSSIIDLLEETRGTELQKQVNSSLVEMESLNVTHALLHGREVFKKNYGYIYEESTNALEALKSHWKNAEDGNKKVAALTDAEKKIFEKLTVFDKECRKKLQQEIDAIEAQQKAEIEAYEALPIERKIILHENEFNVLFDAFCAAGPLALNASERLQEDMSDYIDGSIRTQIQEHLHNKFRAKYTKSPAVRGLILDKKELSKKNQAEVEAISKDVARNIGFEDAFFENRTKLENSLHKLLEQSNGTELQYLVESKVVEVEALDPTISRNGLDRYIKYCPTFLKQYNDVLEALNIYWASSERSVIGKRTLSALTKESRTLFNKWKVFEGEYKKNLQQEVDATEAMEKATYSYGFMYEVQSNEYKLEFLEEKFDDLMKDIDSAKRKYIDDLERNLRQEQDSAESSVLTTHLENVRSNAVYMYSSNAKVQELIAQEQEIIRKNVRIMSDGFERIFEDHTLQSTDIVRLIHHQNKIQFALWNLSEGLTDIELQNRVQSKLAEVVALNIGDVIQPALKIYQRKYDTIMMDVSILRSCVYYAKEEMPQSVKQIFSELTDHGRKLYDKIRLSGRKYRKKVQQKIKAIGAKPSPRASVDAPGMDYE